MPTPLAGIKLIDFKAAYTNLVGAKPTRALLLQASRELLQPVVQRQVNVSGDVSREASLLMGQLNIQLVKLPVSFALTGGKQGPIDGQDRQTQLNDARLGGLTWVGDARETNQDSILFAVDRRTEGAEKDLLLVGDGMGGAKGGNVASEHALLKIESAFSEGEFNLPAAIVGASDSLRAEIAANPKTLEGAGTTLVAALIEPARDQASLVSIGDSRFYLLRQGHLWILTIDDNLLNLQEPPAKPFPLGGEDARAYYDKMRTAVGNNIITRSIGQSELKEADVQAMTVELKEGDLLIGACDGLNALTWEQLENTLAANQAKNPAEIAEALKKALAGLATDNVTVGIYRHVKTKAAKQEAKEPDTTVDGNKPEPTTTVWGAPTEEKAKLIEQATRALEIPAEFAAQFAKLVDEREDYRELAMRDARLALQRTEERDAARTQARGLQADLANLAARMRELEAQNQDLQARLGAGQDRTSIIQPELNLNLKIEQALAEWHQIKIDLDANAEQATTAEARREIQEPLVARSRTLITSEIEPIEAEAREAEAAHLARKARITGQMFADLAKLAEQRDSAAMDALRELAAAAVEEQTALIAATEKEMDEANQETVAKIRAKKDQSPFPRLREHLISQEAKLREAEEMLAQLAREKADISNKRLQPLRDRLAEYEAAAGTVQTGIDAIRRLIAEAKIG